MRSLSTLSTRQSCFTVCPALPCPALPCPALPRPALPCPVPPCPTLPCPTLPCPLLSSLLRRCVILLLAHSAVLLLQIFVLIMAATIAGKLNPGMPTFKLKQSCEAAGSTHFPPLAYLNIFAVVTATVLYLLLLLPGPGVQHAVYNYLVCGLQVVFIWFCNWVRSNFEYDKLILLILHSFCVIAPHHKRVMQCPTCTDNALVGV